MPSIITLLTDFGSSDGYVAAMKGVILSRDPTTTVVDITHAIPPQDILYGAFVLATTYSYFPQGTIHVAVVDPGVGTERRALLLQTPEAVFLAPDNGVLTYVLDKYGGRFSGPVPRVTPHGPPPAQAIPLPSKLQAWSITNQTLFLPDVSRTFHGRDIFASVAAALSNGLVPSEVGPSVNEVTVFPLPHPYTDAAGIVRGSVLHIDRFGNLITNLRAVDIEASATLHIAGHDIEGLSPSYAAGRELLAVLGSAGYVEIAVRDGSAAQKLGVGRGTPVMVHTG